MKKIIKLLLTIPLITTPFYFSCSKNEPPKKQEKNELLKQIEQLKNQIKQLEKEIEKLKNDKKELQKKLTKLNEKKEIIKTNQTIKKDLQKTKKLQVCKNENFTISNNVRN